MMAPSAMARISFLWLLNLMNNQPKITGNPPKKSSEPYELPVSKILVNLSKLKEIRAISISQDYYVYIMYTQSL